MSIPKIIHYCWFGKGPLPEKVKTCIESWRKHCPEYQIIEWNEENYDVFKIPYIRQAYESRKWAFVSDYARLDIIYQQGGFYLDTDVELMKGLDGLLEEKIVLAMEREDYKINTGLGFAAEAHNETIRRLMEVYCGISFIREDGSFNLKACPQYTTEFFEQKGYKLADRTQRIDDALILASDYFCPMDYNTGSIAITGNTIGIHWYEASWQEQENKDILKVERKLRQRFPKGISRILCFSYRKFCRLIEYIRKGILLKKLFEKMSRKIL